MTTIRIRREDLKQAYSILSNITNFSFNVKDRTLKIASPDWETKQGEITESLKLIDYELISN